MHRVLFTLQSKVHRHEIKIVFVLNFNSFEEKEDFFLEDCTNFNRRRNLASLDTNPSTLFSNENHNNSLSLIAINWWNRVTTSIRSRLILVAWVWKIQSMLWFILWLILWHFDALNFTQIMFEQAKAALNALKAWKF